MGRVIFAESMTVLKLKHFVPTERLHSLILTAVAKVTSLGRRVRWVK